MKVNDGIIFYLAEQYL